MKEINEIKNAKDIIGLFQKNYDKLLCAQTFTNSINPLNILTNNELNKFSFNYNYSISIIKNDERLIDDDLKNFIID